MSYTPFSHILQLQIDSTSCKHSKGYPDGKINRSYLHLHMYNLQNVTFCMEGRYLSIYLQIIFICSKNCKSNYLIYVVCTRRGVCIYKPSSQAPSPNDYLIENRPSVKIATVEEPVRGKNYIKISN